MFISIGSSASKHHRVNLLATTFLFWIIDVNLPPSSSSWVLCWGVFDHFVKTLEKTCWFFSKPCAACYLMLFVKINNNLRKIFSKDLVLIAIEAALLLATFLRLFNWDFREVFCFCRNSKYVEFDFISSWCYTVFHASSSSGEHNLQAQMKGFLLLLFWWLK